MLADSFGSPVHTGCAPLHDPPGRQVRECSPSKRYPGLQVKSHLESTSKPRVHVYLPCGMRCSTRQRISETAQAEQRDVRRQRPLGRAGVSTYCGRKPSRTNGGSGGSGWSSCPAVCTLCRTSSHIGCPACSCSAPREESSRWPPHWSVSPSDTRKGLCTKQQRYRLTVGIRGLMYVELHLNDSAAAQC